MNELVRTRTIRSYSDGLTEITIQPGMSIDHYQITLTTFRNGEFEVATIQTITVHQNTLRDLFRDWLF